MNEMKRQMKRQLQCRKTPLPKGPGTWCRRRFSDYAARFFAIFAGLSAGLTNAQTLEPDGRVLVSTNNQNFDISVFDGRAMYNDLGNGVITLTNMLGDGTVLDYKFVGNDAGGTALTVYADGAGEFISDPFAPSENISGGGQDWANVWVTSDPGPDFVLNPKDHSPTGTPGADRTFASAAEVDGTVDITALTEGTVYFPHGTFINNWTITVTMSGPGLPDIVASETQGGNGPGTNYGWISGFSFADAQDYTTLTYNYTNGDRDGSRARFMGVILDGPIESGATFIELAGDDPQIIERATSWTDPGVSGMTDGAGNALGQAELDLITTDSSALDISTPGDYAIVYSYRGNDPLLPTSTTRTVRVVDTEAPTVVLNGDPVITIPAGQPFVDPGATATDANDDAVTTVYGSSGSPAASGATGKWTFDNDSINDSSGNGYNGIAQGTMAYSDDTPYGSGRSIDFRGGNNAFYVEDGTSDQSVFQPIPGLRPPAADEPVLVEQWVVESTGPGFTVDGSTANFVATGAEIDSAVAADPDAATSSWDTVNFGDGNNGRIPGDSFYPGATNNNPDNIAIRATGVLRIPVTGDYDIGFQSDDGSSLLIENTNAVFQTPLLESVGGRVIQVLDTPAVVDNEGSLGEDADLGNAPPSTDPLLDGGDASPLFEQAGALVEPSVPTPVSNNSLLFGGEHLDAPFNAEFNVEDTDVADAINGVTGVPTPGAASEITVEFWAKPTQNGNLLCPINNLVFDGPARSGWLFYQTPDDSWEWRVGDATGYIDPVRAPANAFPNTYDQWNHVVGVLRLDKTDPTAPVYTSEIYVNGVLGNSAVLSRIPQINTFQTLDGAPGTVRVGATNQNINLGPGRQYIGCLDEIAIYDTALSPAQILAHYENGANSPARTQTYPEAIAADSPLAYWRGEEAQPTVDNSLTGMFAPANGGALTGVGRITLEAGDYPISFISRERGGGEYTEVFAKPASSDMFTPLAFQGYEGFPIDSPITISFFAKRDGWAGNWSAMVTKRGEGGQGWQVRRRAGEQKVIFTTRGLGNDDPTQGTNTSVGDGNWHHIVAEYGGAGGNRKLWIDGVLDYDIASTGLMNPAPGFNFAVGATDNNAAPGPNLSNFFQGQMDNVCVFHRTLSEAERFGLLAGGDLVNTNVPGTYTIRYVSLDPSGNAGVVTREVIVEADETTPVITLTGDAELIIEASNDPFVDPGATVAEGPGGTNPGALLDPSGIDVSGDTVDPAVPGTYRLTYNYTDVDNGTALPVERLVRVVDTTGPEITLNGGETIFAVVGEPFVDPGATATDFVSGDSPAYPSGFPGQSLLGRWSFDDAENPGKDDVTGVDLVFGGGAVRGDTGAAVGDGFLNTAGGNRWATVPGGPTGNDLYDMGTNSFTVSAWVRGWPGANWVPFVSKRGEGGQGWQLRRRAGETNATITTRGAGADDNPQGAAVPQDGEWHHIVGRVDRSTNEKTIFVDGIQVGDTGFLNGNQINPATAHALTFAARDNGGGSIGNFASVDLDDIQIYRRALTDSEIGDLADPDTGADVFPTVFEEEGSFEITYTATDGAGNSTSVTRTVTIVPGQPFTITDIQYNDNNTVDITWNSRPGAFYTIEVSTDLENWTEVQDGYESQGDSTSYTYTGGGGILPDPDPTVNPQLYLKVSQD
jgi:hypothetical protein